MALTLYWGSGSPFSWRVLLALEHKGLPYESQLLHFDKQEHQSPQMLKLNPRGRVPVLKDGDYVVFESVAVLYYLDVKYPQAPIFGATPEEAGVIMRVICEFMAYAEPSLLKITEAIFSGQVAENIDELTDAMHVVGREARTIEGRLSKEQWIVGANYSATDMVIFPWIQVLRRALDRSAAAELGRALPAHGAQLSGAGALDSPHRVAARLRAHLSARLVRRESRKLNCRNLSISRAAR
jgi:glutathione S-transferase